VPTDIVIGGNEDQPATHTLAQQGFDRRQLFAGQARLLAERAERGLLITSGSLVRLVQLAEQLDAVPSSSECPE